MEKSITPFDYRGPVILTPRKMGDVQGKFIWSFTILHFRSVAPAVHRGRGASIFASGTPLAQSNRAPDSLLSRLSRAIRRRVAGAPARSRHSSLRTPPLRAASQGDTPRREQAAAFSHSPRQDVWLQTERLLRLQTFVPHSQDSRLPSA